MFCNSLSSICNCSLALWSLRIHTFKCSVLRSLRIFECFVHTWCWEGSQLCAIFWVYRGRPMDTKEQRAKYGYKHELWDQLGSCTDTLVYGIVCRVGCVDATRPQLWVQTIWVQTMRWQIQTSNRYQFAGQMDAQLGHCMGYSTKKRHKTLKGVGVVVRHVFLFIILKTS